MTAEGSLGHQPLCGANGGKDSDGAGQPPVLGLCLLPFPPPPPRLSLLTLLFQPLSRILPCRQEQVSSWLLSTESCDGQQAKAPGPTRCANLRDLGLISCLPRVSRLCLSLFLYFHLPTTLPALRVQGNRTFWNDKTLSAHKSSHFR